MENNLKFDIIPITDLFTQDEWNNILIDMWVDAHRPKNTDVSYISPVCGPTIIITITGANHWQPDNSDLN